MMFSPGDKVIHSTWCGTSVVTLVHVSRFGVHVKHSDGHTELLPTTPNATAGDILARFRHPLPGEIELYGSR